MATRNNWKVALLEGAKEGLRYLLSGVVGWLLTDGVIGVLVDKVFGTTLSVEVRLALVAGLGYVVRGVDKFIHDWNKTELKGIFP